MNFINTGSKDGSPVDILQSAIYFETLELVIDGKAVSDLVLSSSTSEYKGVRFSTIGNKQ